MALIIGLLAVAGLSIGTEPVGLPAVLGGGTGLVTPSLVADLGVAACLAYAYDARGNVAEMRELRRLRALDSVLFLATVAFCAAVMAVSSSDPARAACSVAILTSMSALVTCLCGGATGVLTSTMLVLVTSSYSPALRGASIVRVLQPEAHTETAVIAAVSGTITAAVVLRFGRRIVTTSP